MPKMIRQNEENLPRCYDEFKHIRRYRDATNNNIVAAKILPGEYYVTAHNEMITTVLGSCISVCVYDPVFCVGGMNHFMLPEAGDAKGRWGTTALSGATRYGNFAMEKLINDILNKGGRRKHLKIKVFGGGQIVSNMSNVGAKNIKFVAEFLAREGYAVVAENTGDIFPRKINFFPKTGKVRMKKLKSLRNNTIVERELNYLHEIEEKPVAGAIELF